MDSIGLFLLAAVVLVGIAGIENRMSRADRRVARVERKLDLIMDHLGLSEHDARMDEVAVLAREGRTIQAVKLYREITGEGLKEAKEAVDRLG
jgi:ribosomal protein L7/L12